MATKSPKKRKRKPKPASTPAATSPTSRVPPPSVKKEPLPPDAEKRARQSRKDSAEIEYLIWMSIHG